MRNVLKALLFLLFAQSAAAADDPRGNLASAEWLEKNRQSENLVLIDASFGRAHAAKHIPGAINVDIAFGVRDPEARELEGRLQSWGVSAGKKVVIYDGGGTYLATRLFFDFYYAGFPPADLYVLDGGLAKWEALGLPVTKEPTPAQKKGTFRVAAVKEEARVRLPEFLAASGDPKNHAVVEALEPTYHFGAQKFFDRAGHVPNAIMLPSEDFYNADKTFKSPDEIRRMAKYLGITPEQTVHSYCGGGIAASVPQFALQFIAGYPKVKLYIESQREWLRDERTLPLWTYDAPYLMRDMAWLDGWGGRMQRMFGVANLSVVDVRPAESYKQGHVPFALNLPADVFRKHLASPEKLAEILGPAGVDASHEAVIVSEGGLNERSALAFLMLERLGQKKVSILLGSVDDWGLRGYQLSQEPTVVGPKKSPMDLAIPPGTYRASVRQDVLVRTAAGTQGQYPKVYLASGKQLPAKSPDAKVLHVPYSELLDANGTPKAAKDIWAILTKAGLPRYAEVIVYADDPGEAAVNYVILKLMGYPDVKVLML